MKVVAYRDRDGAWTWAVVLDQDKQRVEVVDRRGRRNRVSRSRIHFECELENTAADTPEGTLQEVLQQRDAMLAQFDLRLLWECARDSAEPLDLAALARLYFGAAPDPVEILTLWWALKQDKVYFRERGNRYEPRRPDQVQALIRQQQIEAERERTFSQMVHVLQRWFHEPDLEFTEEDLQIGRLLVRHFRRQLDRHQTELVNRALSQARLPGGDLKELIPVLQRMGLIEDELEALLFHFGVALEFDPRVVAEARRLPPFSSDPDHPEAREWILAIDDPETREVDDAFGIEWLPGDRVRVSVYITEAAYFVKKDTRLDHDALRRCATLYLPERVVPMLPPVLSMDRASFVAGEMRPAVALRTVWDARGTLQDWELQRAAVRVQKRWTYDEVDAVLQRDDGTAARALRFLYDRARQFLAQRRQAGAVHLVRPEVKVRVDDPHAERPRIRVQRLDLETPARVLVREWMILFNARVAEYAAERGIPMIYRSQEPPEEGLEPIPAGASYDPVAFRSLIRFFRRSVLWPTPRPHWALGLNAYIQMSSPLRRYGDLVTQRQLVHFLERGETLYEKDFLLRQLVEIEDRTLQLKELEMYRHRYWILRYLQQEGDEKLWGATVVAAPSRGTYLVELDPVLHDALLTFPGELEPGSRIRVQIEQIDFKRRTVHVRFVERVEGDRAG